MKKIEVTKTMYETIDGRRFETQIEATKHEANLERYKDVISFAMCVKEMCIIYEHEGEHGDCSSDYPFKKEHDCCMLDELPCNWKLPLINNSPF